MGLRLRDYIPALKFGAKIDARDVAGFAAQPYVGNIFYVDGVNGSDSSGGTNWDDAFASLYKAHDACTDNNFDMIVVASAGIGSGSGTDESTAVSGGLWTFSKNLVTVVGAAAPSFVSPRSRILWDTASQSTTTALLTISGSGNSFVNLQLGTFVDNNMLVTVSGDRNYFAGVHFAGIGDATAGDDTNARILYLNDGDENLFDSCLFGLDTIMRSAANFTVEMAGGVQRNTFSDCMFIQATDATTPVHIKSTGASGLDRWNRFHNSVFYNFTTNDTAEPAAVFDLSAQTATGHVLLTGSQMIRGIDNWESTASGRLYIQPYTATANAIGQAINPTVD